MALLLLAVAALQHRVHLQRGDQVLLQHTNTLHWPLHTISCPCLGDAQLPGLRHLPVRREVDVVGPRLEAGWRLHRGQANAGVPQLGGHLDSHVVINDDSEIGEMTS